MEIRQKMLCDQTVKTEERERERILSQFFCIKDHTISISNFEVFLSGKPEYFVGQKYLKIEHFKYQNTWLHELFPNVTQVNKSINEYQLEVSINL